MAKKVKKATKKAAPAKKKAASKKKAAPKAKAEKKAVAKKKSPKKAVSKKKAVKKAAKRVVARSTAAAEKNPKLTPEEIEGYRRLLLEKWVELLSDVSYIENEALRKSRLDAAGDLSSMPIHMADLGTDNFEQEFSLGLMDSERKILAEIVAALRRISDGTYGICEGTGKNISKARLQANPWARYCIDYARMVEKGTIREGEKVYSEPDESFDDETDELDEDYEDDLEESGKPSGVLDDDDDEDEDIEEFAVDDEEEEDDDDIEL